MGILKFGRNKEEKVEITEEEIANDAAETSESSAMKSEEVANMPETKYKKYIYLALDENGMVILDRDMKPIVSNISAENTPVDWPSYVSNYAKKVVSDTLLRVEVPELKPEDRYRGDKAKRAAKQQLREEAKEELFRLATDKIDEAKKVKNEENIKKKLNRENTECDENAQKEKNQENAEWAIIADKAHLDQGATNPNIDESRETVESTELNNAAFMVSVDKLGEQIAQDISNSVDDILGTIAENDKALISDIQGIVKEQVKILDERTRYIGDSVNMLVQKTKKAAEDVSRKVYDNGRSISDSHDKLLSKVKVIDKRMGDLAESVEGIEGDLARFDQLDEIVNLLRDKHLNISMEIPPINAEEDDIINLVRYSQKISEQLGYAARDLIRKQAVFKSQAESNENEQKIMTQKIEAARKEGIAEGKMQVLKQLLSKYENVDTIKDSKENYIHVIWTMLTELGVVIDGNGFYEKGNEIELSDEDIEKMMATYSKFEGAGKYRVVRTGLLFQEENISVAQFEKIPEETLNSAEGAVSNRQC